MSEADGKNKYEEACQLALSGFIPLGRVPGVIIMANGLKNVYPGGTTDDDLCRDYVAISKAISEAVIQGKLSLLHPRTHLPSSAYQHGLQVTDGPTPEWLKPTKPDAAWLLKTEELIEWAEAKHIPVGELLNIFRTRQKDERALALSSSEARCRQWLCELMKQGDPEKAKADYQSEARFRFSGLSVRGFNRAWAEAVGEIGNENWSKPGRKS